jgi:hypothetical protein
MGPIDPGSRLLVKGRAYEVSELTGDPADKQRYAGGSFAIVYLSPRDYHRVHSPVDGVIRTVRVVGGDLYPVNPIGERHVPKLLATNHRVAICIDSERFGRVSAVMVGAIVVGRISVKVLNGRNFADGTHTITPEGDRSKRRRDWHLPPGIDRRSAARARPRAEAPRRPGALWRFADEAGMSEELKRQTLGSGSDLLDDELPPEIPDISDPSERGTDLGK